MLNISHINLQHTTSTYIFNNVTFMISIIAYYKIFNWDNILCDFNICKNLRISKQELYNIT